MAESKPRIFQDSRDMVLSLGVCFVVILCCIGFTGLCSFHPGRPDPGVVRKVDAKTFLGLEARATGFPLVYPEAPKGFIPNSARRSNVEGHIAPIVGWVTPRMAYLQLIQTNQPLKNAVNDYDEVARTTAAPVTVAGHTWQKFVPEDSSKDTIWATTNGTVTWIVTGTAGPKEFAMLATAIAHARPIPVTSSQRTTAPAPR